jgi:hypothetical protein
MLKWICAVLLVAISPASAAPATLTGREIVDRAAARDQILRAHRGAFTVDLTITRDKLDDDDKVTSTHVEHMVFSGDNRPSFGTRSAPGAPDAEAKKASQEEPFEMLKIIDHYNYALVGEETVNGILCYKVSFVPKPDMPYDNREEKVLNAVSGYIWAGTEDFSLVRNQGELTHPVSVAWIFASLEKMNFHFDAMPMPNGDYAPREEQYGYLVSIPFFTLHERDTRQFSNYRLIGATAAPQ